MLDILRLSKIEDYPIFSLKGVITYGKILKNYDGDTADCLIIYKENIMRFKVRFYGYDSPEMKPSLNIENREEIILKAKEAKRKLWKECSGLDDINEKEHNKIIKILCDDFDKYGRLLITAFDYELNKELNFENSINKKMIEEGYGYSYLGGKKNI